MNRYTYDRVGRGQYAIREASEGVIARTDDHRAAEKIVAALNRVGAAAPSLPLSMTPAGGGKQEDLVRPVERRDG